MNDDIKVKILKDAVIVAGHPRSGTSLACQLVESAGVKFPSDFAGDDYNKGGYYELALSKDLSKRLIKKAMTVENTIDMNKIIERLNSCRGTAGLKIVRIPAIFFYRHVARNLKAVFVYRNPADVKASLFRRGISGFSPGWLENNNALIAAYENIENSIVVSYESLLSGKEWVKQGFQKLGLDVDLDLVKKEERTQQRSRVLVTAEEEKMYQILQELERESCRV
ncbi:sulfotransferase family protein [Halothermothrix orenii]|uniref:Sulfotransferase domain-containing protein n=1 Tax=Halothermothrix orenii (strain H 168 / OCM 544 / DSM 9562) TaxID=373903 RepID=B8D0P7_HALOH|nr:sulfotransferase family protein [Halothermothrix orenii]ACL70983.1 hypothetical protein Hore_22380 [Halothermothrix orenii H 168]